MLFGSDGSPAVVVTVVGPVTTFVVKVWESVVFVPAGDVTLTFVSVIVVVVVIGVDVIRVTTEPAKEALEYPPKTIVADHGLANCDCTAWKFKAVACRENAADQHGSAEGPGRTKARRRSSPGASAPYCGRSCLRDQLAICPRRLSPIFPRRL
jgi:hypothetical protein